MDNGKVGSGETEEIERDRKQRYGFGSYIHFLFSASLLHPFGVLVLWPIPLLGLNLIVSQDDSLVSAARKAVPLASSSSAKQHLEAVSTLW
jgi:hypothetical protein